MTIRIKLRRDTAANWATENPILALAEPGLETDTGRMKYGDGVTAWNSLDYYAPNVERNRAGWVTTWGERFANDSTQYWWESVTADNDGNVYLTGGDQNSTYASVTKLNSDGAVQWNKTLNGPDGYEGDGIDIKLDADGNPVTLSYVYNNDNSIDELGYNIHKLNKTSGAIIGSGYRVKDETDNGSQTGSIYPRELAIDGNGDYVVVGSRYGDRRESNITTATGSTVNLITFQRDPDMPYPEEYSSSFVVTQDNTSTWTVTDVNRYNTLAPSVTYDDTGMNLTLNIEIVSGTATATVADGGTNYTEGRIVKVLGSAAGGVDVTNDLTITITTVTNGGVVTGVSGVSGTSGTDGTYTNVATSIEAPTTPTVDLLFRLTRAGTYYKPVSGGTGGAGHSVGDTLTVVGTEFVGGATPDNDWVATVTTVDSSGGITALSTATWSPPTDYLKLGVDAGGNDFSTGTYKLRINTEEQAFVHKHGNTNWAKTIGGIDDEYFFGVTLDSSNNIYAVGERYNPEYPNGSRWEGLVVKLNSAGTVQWSKSFDIDGYEGYGEITNAVTDSNNDIYLVQPGNPVTITKIDTDGEIIYQKTIGDGDPISFWNTTIEVDSDDNIYVASEINSADNPTDDFLIIKFDSSGNLVWQRSIGTMFEESSVWNNGYSWFSVKGDKLYFSGTTLAYNHSNQEYRDIAFCVQLTTDGNWLGESDIWQMTEPSWTINTINSGDYLVTNINYVSTSSDATVYTPTFTQTDNTDDINTDILHRGDDVTITGVSRIEFEDGAVIDKYAGRNIPPMPWDTTYGGAYFLGPREAGRFILLEDDTNSSTFYIPSDDVVDLPVGTVFTIVIINKQNNVYVNYYGGNTPVIHASGSTGSDTNWELASNGNDGTYTIMKVKPGWWIINGPDVVAV